MGVLAVAHVTPEDTLRECKGAHRTEGKVVADLATRMTRGKHFGERTRGESVIRDVEHFGEGRYRCMQGEAIGSMGSDRSELMPTIECPVAGPSGLHGAVVVVVGGEAGEPPQEFRMVRSIDGFCICLRHSRPGRGGAGRLTG